MTVFSRQLAELDLTGADLSRLTGVSPPAISHYVTGHSDPSQIVITWLNMFARLPAEERIEMRDSARQAAAARRAEERKNHDKA